MALAEVVEVDVLLEFIALFLGFWMKRNRDGVREDLGVVLVDGEL